MSVAYFFLIHAPIIWDSHKTKIKYMTTGAALIWVLRKSHSDTFTSLSAMEPLQPHQPGRQTARYAHTCTHTLTDTHTHRHTHTDTCTRFICCLERKPLFPVSLGLWPVSSGAASHFGRRVCWPSSPHVSPEKQKNKPMQIYMYPQFMYIHVLTL